LTKDFNVEKEPDCSVDISYKVEEGFFPEPEEDEDDEEEEGIEF
jgi:hypothetical protein